MANQMRRVTYLADGGEEQIVGHLQVHTAEITIVSKYDGLSPSGFLCIRKDAIVAVEADDETRFFEEILRSSGVESHVFSDHFGDLNSFDGILSYCIDNRKVVAVEGYQEGDFAIVRIYGVSDDSIMIRSFQPSGDWDAESNYIKKNDVSNLLILDAYCEAVDSFT